MVEQGAVGNVSKGELGGIQRKNVITNSRIPGKKWWKMEKSCPVATWPWVSVCSTPLRLATNGHVYIMGVGTVTHRSRLY